MKIKTKKNETDSKRVKKVHQKRSKKEASKNETPHKRKKASTTFQVTLPKLIIRNLNFKVIQLIS